MIKARGRYAKRAAGEVLNYDSNKERKLQEEIEKSDGEKLAVTDSNYGVTKVIE